MNKLTKIILIVAAALILLVSVALVAVQSPWFQNYVKDKVIATVEDSTGGRVEIGSFHFDLWGLTVRITDFTLHGTEPANVAPLAHLSLLELHLKLFAGLKKTIDLAYLGINELKINLIANPDGTTNIPAPKIKKQPGQTSGLETVVDLAIGQFRIDRGSLLYSQKSSAFSARGQDLGVLLNFNSFNSTYTGHLLIDPLVLSSGTNPPVNVKVNLPLMLEKDAVNISGGTLNTPLSQILINAGLRDLNSPKITARVNANLAPSEFGLSDISQHLVADLGAMYDDKTGEIDVQSAHLAFGQSNFQASGAVIATANQSVQFSGKLEMDELAHMFKVAEPMRLGLMNLRGHLKMDAPKDYSLDANVNALGGSAALNLLLKNLQQVTLNGHLSNFAVNDLGYSGVLGGVVDAQIDLKAKGTSGLSAQARILVSPGSRGIPVNGQIDARFSGASNIVQLDKSYVALPNSRIDLSGILNKQLNASLVSHNLNDFSPLMKSQPVTLQGGTARLDAQVQGDLSSPRIQAHASVDRFAVQGSSFKIFAADLAASPSKVVIQNGNLNGAGLTASFNASIGLRKWKPLASSPLTANADVVNGRLASLLALAGQKDETAAGTLNAQIHVNGTYGDPLGSANVQALNGVISSQPFDKVQGHVDLAHQLITLTGFEVDAAGGQLLARGTLRHPADSFQTGHVDFHLTSTDIQLANVQSLQKQSPGLSGVLKLSADGSGDIGKDRFQPSNVTADLSARGLKLNDQAAGDVIAHAQTANGSVNYTLHSNFAGSNIQADGTTSLTQDYPTKATASIANLPVEQALLIAGEGTLPVKGLLSLYGNVSGTIAKPDASFDVTLAKAVVYSEPLNELSTRIHYTPSLIDISNLNLKAPAGTLTAAAHFAHTAGDLDNGQIQLHLNTGDIDLSKIRQIAMSGPVTGSLKLNADIAGDLKNKALLLSDANANINANTLQASGMNFGDLQATAQTSQHIVHYNIESNIARSNVKATGETELNKDYVTHAKLAFRKLQYANLVTQKPAFNVLVDGDVSVDGPVLDLDGLTGRLQLNQFVFEAGSRSRKVHLENDAPVILALDHSVVKVQHLKIQDAKSYLQASGALSLKDATNALGLKLEGNADLGILQSADRDFYSSGAALLNADIHGTVAKPLVNGRIELQKANVNYIDASNGISNGNGVILLNGSNATVQNLTGESGGGKISVTGFAGFTPTDVTFNLRATANKVRTRYSDASITSNADISLAGTSHRSTLSGTVTVQRIAYSSNSDVGSFLSTASAPPSTPAAPSPLLTGMRLDLRIVTAPDIRVISTYTDKISLQSSLTVSGTAEDPGIVGRVNITNGELVFFGNTYTVNTGSINFYNANAIQPILNLSLETLTQGVDVTLGVTGPVTDLKLSYRSDPPLSFEQIVQLLATNTTPSDPTIAAHQPTPPQQSASQMGESAVLGQAVANPLASRVQRVFGLTQFKIDPSLSGSNGQPTARVTLQQKIANNLTFTYITDVTQTNSEIVRVTFDITPKISAVALRDYNGNVSVELFYKFQVR